MEFLLEVLTEEMPPSHIPIALEQLETGLNQQLIANDLTDEQRYPGKITTYGTCRRLIVSGELAPRQRDKEELILGPPRSVAFDERGEPKAAALGFARSQGVSVDRLEVIKSPKGEYLGLRKSITGKPTPVMLSDILPALLAGLSFPKMMRWGKNPFRFSRPIKGILCLCDDKPLNFQVAGVTAGDSTIGHKILCPESFRVESTARYHSALRARRVITDAAERRKKIEVQIEKKLAPLEAQILADEQLLTKLTYDVEWPMVFLGNFPEEYLKLPLEISSTAMKAGQNLFAVIKGRRQLPYFVGVADAVKDPKALIRSGNERVLKARLEDARFFWEQDVRVLLADRARELNQIVFQEQLGTYADKAVRIKKIVDYLVVKLDAGKEKRNVGIAAEICKSDLLTEMVKEFPALQGIVGGLYARKEGHPAAVWKAIYEHYLPVHLDGPVPSTVNGALLSMADKLDTIVGVIGTGVEITGSKDPFGLRRHAQGFCAIVLERKVDFSFRLLLDKVIKIYGDRLTLSKDEVRRRCSDFIQNRMQYILERSGFRYDLVNAALSPGIDRIHHAALRLKAVNALKDSPQFESMIMIVKRVNNIVRGQSAYKINPELLVEKVERELHSNYSIIHDNVHPLIAKGDFIKAQNMIFRLGPSINTFFDKILVMDENKKLQRNRLALLQAIRSLFLQVADYSKIVIEG